MDAVGADAPNTDVAKKLLDGLKEVQYIVQERETTDTLPLNTSRHFYQHNASYMMLPSSVRPHSARACDLQSIDAPVFVGITLYTDEYRLKTVRLLASCVTHNVCCLPVHVPADAFGAPSPGKSATEIVLEFRSRLIATKPLFIYEALQRSVLPVVWLDTDLEFHQYPHLFAAAWEVGPCDLLLWNWQANVTGFHGRRLKMASGVAFFNQTQAAVALTRAWAEAMAFGDNVLAPDDQVMDLLVNNDGWFDRVTFGWLPAAYLRMPRFKGIEPVLDHDRGRHPGSNGPHNSIKPVLPPRLASGGL